CRHCGGRWGQLHRAWPEKADVRQVYASFTAPRQRWRTRPPRIVQVVNRSEVPWHPPFSVPAPYNRRLARHMFRPDLTEFLRVASTATLVPVSKSVSADLLTPVSAFLAIAEREPHAFLLESVEGGEKVGRYTFLGTRPYMRIVGRPDGAWRERG